MEMREKMPAVALRGMTILPDMMIHFDLSREKSIQAVEQAIRSWFDGRLLGQNILRAKLGELAFAVDGVKNYAIDAPAADVAVESDVLPYLESITVSELEAAV